MITILIGKSASGKDTMLRQMIIDGQKPIVSYTTRPKRVGEVDGRDYNFVTKKEFESLINDGKLLEHRAYQTSVGGQSATWYYGSPVVDPNKKHAVVLDPQGAMSYIKAYGKDAISLIYLKVDDKERERRARQRGSFDKTEWDRRTRDDAEKFSDEVIKVLRAKVGRITEINN